MTCKELIGRFAVICAAIMLTAPSITARSESERAAALPGLISSADGTAAILRADGTTAVISHDPHFGDVADLPASGGGAAHLDEMLRMEGGTISFWVRPEWSADSAESHTLLSARWDDPRQSYLAISEGWWEPAGAGRLYFIVSNEDIVHCSSDIRLPPQVWSLVTATWNSGSRGFCRLYVDDELRASIERRWSGGKSLQQIQLGSDAGAPNGRGRTATAGIAGLKILHYAASHREVIARYRAEEDPAAIYRKKWAWMDKDWSLAGSGRTPSAPSGSEPPRVPFARVIFDEDTGWARSPAEIDERLRRIIAAGFSVYVPCVWHGRGLVYRSDAAAAEPSMQAVISNGWDPLAYLVKAAHARGVAVYPWFTVVRREDHAHPEWAQSGTPLNAYDAHEPGFRDFAIKLLLDVVARYDVDGVNLDYIRTMGVCVSMFCQKDYLAETGAQLLTDYRDGAPDPGARLRIQSWQDAAIVKIVAPFAEQARAIKPGLIISIDGHLLDAATPRPLEGRDESTWANRNWVDVIFHMDYRPEIDVAAMQSARARLATPAKLWLLAGNWDFVDGRLQPRSGRWVRGVVDFAQSKLRDRGVALHMYASLSNEQVEALRSAAVR